MSSSLLSILVVVLTSVSFVMAFGSSGSGAAPGPTDEDAPQEFSKSDSGLKYRVLRKATGKRPTANDTVTVHYRGWLEDESEFDSSYKRNQPTTFPLNRVIKGWTEGLQ